MSGVGTMNGHVDENSSSSSQRSTDNDKGSKKGESQRYVDIIREKPIRVTVRVLVPVREHPKFNFVGKLLGPKGNSMKRLQEETLTKMAILGRGSMRDKEKEEHLRASGDPKYLHLAEELHVEITAFAPPAEAHARIAYALAEIRRYLVPDNNDEIRKEQIREMEQMSTDDHSVNDGSPGKDESPPELLSPEPNECIGPPVIPVSTLRPPRVLAPPARLVPVPPRPLVRKLPPRPPLVHQPPAKRRILSILDKAKAALDQSYGLHEAATPDERFFEATAVTPAEYGFEAYGEFPEEYSDLYQDGFGVRQSNRWAACKPMIASIPPSERPQNRQRNY